MIGISPDEVEAIAKFDGKNDLGFTLLADADHAVADAYGTWVEKSMYGKKYMGVARATFIIGPDGKVAKVFPNAAQQTRRVGPQGSGRARRRLSAVRSGGQHDDGDEGAGKREPARDRRRREATAAVEAEVGEQAAGQAEADREHGVAVERPVGEEESRFDRDRRLEDHRAADVAERQRVLALATQKKLLTFSGSSVASGARISARTRASTRGCRRSPNSRSTKSWAPPTIAPRPTRSCSRQSESAGSVRRSGRRSKCSGASVSSPWTSPAVRRRAVDVEAVGEEEGEADRDSQRRRRTPGKQAGDGEAGEEEEQVALQGGTVGVELDALATALPKQPAKSPTSPIARVASRNGAPTIAPIATPSEPSVASSRATIAISVSGVAVPTAARMLPTAPSPSPSRCPSH